MYMSKVHCWVLLRLLRVGGLKDDLNVEYEASEVTNIDEIVIRGFRHLKSGMVSRQYSALPQTVSISFVPMGKTDYGKSSSQTYMPILCIFFQNYKLFFYRNI